MCANANDTEIIGWTVDLELGENRARFSERGSPDVGFPRLNNESFRLWVFQAMSLSGNNYHPFSNYLYFTIILLFHDFFTTFTLYIVAYVFKHIFYIIYQI